MSLGRVEHEVSEILIGCPYSVSFGLVLISCNLAIEVSDNGLDWGGWSKRISVSECLILVRWYNHGHGQLFQTLTSRTSVSQTAQMFTSLDFLSFLLDGLSDLSRMPDSQIRLLAELVLTLSQYIEKV